MEDFDNFDPQPLIYKQVGFLFFKKEYSKIQRIMQNLQRTDDPFINDPIITDQTRRNDTPAETLNLKLNMLETWKDNLRKRKIRKQLLSSLPFFIARYILVFIPFTNWDKYSRALNCRKWTVEHDLHFFKSIIRIISHQDSQYFDYFLKTRVIPIQANLPLPTDEKSIWLDENYPLNSRQVIRLDYVNLICYTNSDVSVQTLKNAQYNEENLYVANKNHNQFFFVTNWLAQINQRQSEIRLKNASPLVTYFEYLRTEKEPSSSLSSERTNEPQSLFDKNIECYVQQCFNKYFGKIIVPKSNEKVSAYLTHDFLKQSFRESCREYDQAHKTRVFNVEV